MIERIVLESHGSPFLAAQLGALAITEPSWGEEQLANLSLQPLVLRRSSTLSSGARRLLNVLAIAGRPIAIGFAVRVAGIERDLRALIHEPRGLRLVRTREVAAERLLEVYHDRLRKVIQGALSAEERLALNRELLAE